MKRSHQTLPEPASNAGSPLGTVGRRAALAGLALVATAAMLAACQSKPTLRADADPAADLRSYKTFAWFDAGAAAPAGAAGGYTTLLDQRLKAATRTQLERQGYRYSETAPDLRVNLFLAVAEKQELRTTPASVGRFGYRGWNNVDIDTYRAGTLAVDLIDARRMALVWRGVAEGRLDARMMEQPGPAIDAAMGELFTRFPGAAS